MTEPYIQWHGEHGPGVICRPAGPGQCEVLGFAPSMPEGPDLTGA